MDNLRMMDLLKRAVEHIEAFEEDEAQLVLYSIGFTKNDLAEIQTEIHVNDEDKENMNMVTGNIFHNGEVVWILSKLGEKYIFSDQTETEDGWITECVPFKSYNHYISVYEYAGEYRYVGYAWYNKNESYIQEFKDFEECLDWLVGVERERLWVCEHCLAAIESREGNQATMRHRVEGKDSKCDWCEEKGFDTLYELV